MRRFERDGRWVEVGETRKRFFGDRPCYEIDGRGDHAFFLGSAAELLYMQETPDGWTIGYFPTDEYFAADAAELVKLDAWK